MIYCLELNIQLAKNYLLTTYFNVCQTLDVKSLETPDLKHHIYLELGLFLKIKVLKVLRLKVKTAAEPTGHVGYRSELLYLCQAIPGAEGGKGNTNRPRLREQTIRLL